MIDDAGAEKVLDWLRDNAEKEAIARSHKVLLEESSRIVKARLMKESGQDTLGAQEREAYASEEYSAHVVGLSAAVYEDTKLTLLRKAAEAKIEAYRTMCSNNRAIGKVV